MTEDTNKPGGSTPQQYGLPEDATDLQDLIEHRGMNFALGNIFKACYRRGSCSHSDELRDMRKIMWFAQREVYRLEREKFAEEVRKDREQRAEELSKWHESNPDATVPTPLDATLYGGDSPASRIAQQIREAKNARDDVLPAAKVTPPTEPEEPVYDYRKGPGNPYT